MSKEKKYGLIFTLIIFVGIGLSINFLFKQMDSKLTSIIIDDDSIKIMNSTYNIEDITDVELLNKVILQGVQAVILLIPIMDIIKLMEIILNLKYVSIIK